MWKALEGAGKRVAVGMRCITDELCELCCNYGTNLGESMLLRVKLEVERGLMVRTTVEPVRPS